MPTVVHEHFDAAGEKTGHTIITTESAWNEETRGRALRLAEYKAGLCPCGCGLPIAEAQKEQPFLVDTVVCQARRALDQVMRQKANDAKVRNLPEGWDDGLRYYVKPTTVDDERSTGGH